MRVILLLLCVFTLNGCVLTDWLKPEPEVRYVTVYKDAPNSISMPNSSLLKKCSASIPLLESGDVKSIKLWRAKMGVMYLKCANNNNSLVDDITKDIKN